jgi:hypothetical protein
MRKDPASLKEMTPGQVAKWWPNLNTSNHHITSDKNILYNCVAWITRITDENIDFSQDENGDLVNDLSAAPYVRYFERFGFRRCIDAALEPDLEKIALFETPNGNFEHVARQLENGHWSSKLGEYEDIEHYNLQSLENINWSKVI